jgi:hypothetical protein
LLTSNNGNNTINSCNLIFAINLTKVSSGSVTASSLDPNQKFILLFFTCTGI